MKNDKIKRVAVYVRVSTNNDDQRNSIENQKKYFMEYIEDHEDWELYKIYADEGISGTSVNHRIQFKNMIYDAECGKFDIILTKEVCRFARNTVDTLEKTRELKRIGIEVKFLIDNISTFDTDGELRLTIIGGLAQDESRRLSERTNFGIKQEMKKGKVFGNIIYGYDIINRELKVVPQEAKIVKEIFDLYLNKDWGYYKIAKDLTQRRIPVKRQRSKNKISCDWYAKTIKGILMNEKYMGDLIQGKTYTESYLRHTRKYNNGETNLYVFKNHHNAIIDSDTYYKVQNKIKEKSKIYVKNNQNEKSPFSGKIKCGLCGSNFYCAYKSKRNNGTTRTLWKCRKSIFYGKKIDESDSSGCNASVVSEYALRQAFKIAVTQANIEYNGMKNDLIERVTNIVVRENDNALETKNTLLFKKENLQAKKKKVLDLYLNDFIITSIYNDKVSEIEEEICLINEKLKTALTDEEKQDEINKLVNRVTININNFISDKSDLDIELCDKILEKIMIYDRRNAYVYLRGFDEPFHINNLNELDDINRSYTWAEIDDDNTNNRKKKQRKVS